MDTAYIFYLYLAHVLLDIIEREEFWAYISLALPDEGFFGDTQAVISS